MSSSESSRSASRLRSASWMSTIARSARARARWKTTIVVDAVQELGPEVRPQLVRRPARCSSFVLAGCRSSMHVLACRCCDVMMMTVFLKSTVRPWPSVRRPSSSTWSSTLNTSGCAFSISSKRMTRVRPAAHRLGELAALLVADVARRRADEPRDRVLLHVLAHVDAHHRPLVVEQELGERPRELGLADAGRAEEDERADRPRSGRRARRASGEPRSRPPRAPRPARRRARASRSSMRRSFCISPSSILRDRNAGPLRDDLGDVLLGDLFLQHAVVLLDLRESRASLLESASRARESCRSWISAALPRSPARCGAARSRVRSCSICSLAPCGSASMTSFSRMPLRLHPVGSARAARRARASTSSSRSLLAASRLLLQRLAARSRAAMSCRSTSSISVGMRVDLHA